MGWWWWCSNAGVVGFGGNGCWDGILVVKVVAACRRKRENK